MQFEPAVIIGDRVRRARHLRGMTGKELAARCGVSAPIISRYEAGSVAPGRTVLVAMADALRVPVEYLLGRVPLPSDPGGALAALASGENMEEFGRVIRDARLETGMSQTELGQRLGVSRNTVGKWERGGGPLHIMQIIAVADLLGIGLEPLTGEPGPLDAVNMWRHWLPGLLRFLESSTCWNMSPSYAQVALLTCVANDRRTSYSPAEWADLLATIQLETGRGLSRFDEGVGPGDDLCL